MGPHPPVDRIFHRMTLARSSAVRRVALPESPQRCGAAGRNRRAVYVELSPVDLVFEIEFLLELIDNPIERAVLNPRPKTVVDGLPFAVPVERISRRSAGAQDPEQTVDNLLVILVWTPTPLYLRKKVVDLFKLIVGQFKASASHPIAGDR